jgi:hypothetical protein
MSTEEELLVGYEGLNNVQQDTSTIKYPSDIPEAIRSWVIGMLPQKQLQARTIRKTYANFSTAATTNTIEIINLPKYGQILSCFMNVVQAFSGTNITNYTISVGPTGTETTLQTAQAVTTTGLKKAIGTDFTASVPIYSTTTSTSIVAKATSAGANLNAASGLGIVDFFILYLTYPDNL